MTLPLHGYPDWQRSLMTADLVSVQTAQALNGGGFFNSNALDMRVYSSASITATINTNAVATAYNEIAISMIWYDDATFTRVVYEDIYWIFAGSTGGGAFTSPNGRFELQDAVHGPFLRITFFSGGPDNCTIDLEILGNSRSLGRRYVGNKNGLNGLGSTGIDFNDDVLYAGPDALGAGVTLTKLFRLAPGPISMAMTSFAGANLWSLVRADGLVMADWNIPAGTRYYQEFALPKSACFLTIQNLLGAPNTCYTSIISKRDNW